MYVCLYIDIAAQNHDAGVFATLLCGSYESSFISLMIGANPLMVPILSGPYAYNGI